MLPPFREVKGLVDFYTAAALLTCCALAVLGILVHENSRLSQAAKHRFYGTYLVIVAAQAAEWAGLALNGAPGWTCGLHAFVKSVDYAVTPVAGVCFIYQVAPRNPLRRYMWALLAVNALAQVISIFTGWTFYLDEANFYHHGPYHFLYILVYLSAIVAVIYEFIRYGRGYQRQNRGSIIAIGILMILGIALYELLDLHVSYLTIALCSCLLFIHYSEFTQLQSDDTLQLQRRLLETDALTHLYSRYAYIEDLSAYESGTPLPGDLAIFSIDANELKATNDELGHLAGDELISGAADCIAHVLGPYGRCYRTGGDEFIAILHIAPENAVALVDKLSAATASWKGQLVSTMHLAIGMVTAAGYPSLSIEKLVVKADEAMYAAKRDYYKRAGNGRHPRG